MKRDFGGKIAYYILIFVMLIVALVTLYPFWYCLVYSLSDPMAAVQKNIVLLPAGFSLYNYQHVFEDKRIFAPFFISVARTVAGVIWAVSVTGLASYAISKRKLPCNRAISIFLIIPMYISGGLIPTYVLMHDLHLFNNFLVYILPNGFWAFNMLLMRTYYDTIPPSLEESAKLDGAGDLRIFIRIIFPLSMPVISVIAMFTGVWHWNSWFDTVLYVTKKQLFPLQVVIQQLIQEAYVSPNDLKSGNLNQRTSTVVFPEAFRMATILVTIIPIVLVYPFFQKYFVRGVMIGAVKA